VVIASLSVFLVWFLFLNLDKKLQAAQIREVHSHCIRLAIALFFWIKVLFVVSISAQEKMKNPAMKINLFIYLVIRAVKPEFS